MRRLLAILILFGTAATTVGAEVGADGHRDAASELLGVMEMEQTMLGGSAAMADAMIQQNSMMAPYRDVLVEWSVKIMTWETFEPKLVEIYTEAFSEAELRELIRFYQTPTGMKTIQLMPELMRKGALLGGEVAAKHTDELRQMIDARSAELTTLEESKK
jgi:hypothetical protein